MRERVDRSAGPSATSQRVILPGLAFFMASNALSTPITSIDAGFKVIAVLTITGVVAWLWFSLWALVMQGPLNAASVARAWAVLLLFASTEISRTLLTHASLDSLGIESATHWVFYIVGGFTNGLIIFGIISIVVNDLDVYRDDYRALFEQRRKLESLATSSVSMLEASRRNLLQSVQLTLNTAIQAAFTTTPGNEHRVVDNVLAVSNDVVRPLSHELYDNTEQIEIVHIDAEPPRLRLGEIVDLAIRSRPFRPSVLTLLFLGIGMPSAFLLNPTLRSVAEFLAAALTLFVLTWLSEQLMKRVGRRLNVGVGLVLVTLLYVIIGECAGVIYQMSVPIAETAGFVAAIAIIAVVVGWITALTEGLRVGRAELLARIADANSDIDWRQVRLQSEIWLEQQRIAQLLHTDVQGALIAGALKYVREIENGEDTNAAKHEFRILVSHAVNEALTLPREVGLDAALNYLTNRWSGAVNLSVKLEPHVWARLADDEVAVRVADGIVNEAITNAIKHGHARDVQVRFETPEDDVLCIIVSHQGEVVRDDPGEAQGMGLGIKLIKAVALDLELRNVGDSVGAELRVRIPLNVKA